MTRLGGEEGGEQGGEGGEGGGRGKFDTELIRDNIDAPGEGEMHRYKHTIKSDGFRRTDRRTDMKTDTEFPSLTADDNREMRPRPTKATRVDR